MPRKPLTIKKLMRSKSGLRDLQKQINLQQQLLSQVKAALPEKLAKHCISTQIQASTLVVFTDSPVWASKLRFLSPQVLSQLRSQHPGLSNLAVKLSITQRASPLPEKKRRLAQKSDVAASIVGDSAAGTLNSALRSALERLSRALRK